jgi:hypothetical protein
MPSNSTAVLFGLVLAGCGLGPDPSPPGTIEFPLVAGQEAAVEWQAEEHRQAIWLDLETSGGRALGGPIRVEADGTEVVAGTYRLDGGGVVSRSSAHNNWASTPWFARGQEWLLNLDEVAPGTSMRLVARFEAKPGTRVDRLVLQVRPWVDWGPRWYPWFVRRDGS